MPMLSSSNSPAVAIAPPSARSSRGIDRSPSYRAADAWSLEALLGGRMVPKRPDTDPPPPEVAELRDPGRRVRQAIGELPASQRTAVSLFYLADLSHAEIAALLGIQPGAVKTRLHKARERQVVLLAGRDGDRLLPVWVGGFEGDAPSVCCMRRHVGR
jgi:hypothetical protein